jgi:hypothetical protein
MFTANMHHYERTTQINMFTGKHANLLTCTYAKVQTSLHALFCNALLPTPSLKDQSFRVGGVDLQGEGGHFIGTDSRGGWGGGLP